jgi:hypothetical protein
MPCGVEPSQAPSQKFGQPENEIPIIIIVPSDRDRRSEATTKTRDLQQQQQQKMSDLYTDFDSDVSFLLRGFVWLCLFFVKSEKKSFDAAVGVGKRVCFTLALLSFPLSLSMASVARTLHVEMM